MKKIWIVCLAVLAMMVGFSACAPKDAVSKESPASDESWKKIQDKGVMVVGLAAAYPPFESRNESTGEIEGFDVDLAKALSSKLGVDVEIKDADWQALLGGLQKGDFDILITCMSRKEAAADNVNTSDTYYELADVIITKQENDSIRSPKDLEGKTVGVQLASASEQLVDKMEGIKEVQRYNYNPEAFIDLANGRIDAVVVGYAYAVNYMKENKGFRIAEEILGSDEVVMVMRPGENEFTSQINGALKSVKEDGTYETLVKKWLSVE